MSVFMDILISICDFFGDIFLTNCPVCHQVFFHIGRCREAFNHCAGDHNDWGFGRRPLKRNERRTFTCPVCGKQYTDHGITKNSEADAAYAAFRCCPRPENQGLRNLTPAARERRTDFGYPSYYVITYNSKDIPYATEAAAERSEGIYRPTQSTCGQTCPECGGTGLYNGVMCDRCGGTGKLLV